MKGTRFVKIISTFSKEEWISYRKYLLMCTVVNSDIYRVFSYLQKRKDRLHSLPEINEIRIKHFESLSQKSILNILSKLHLWTEEWLVYNSTKNDKMESDLILVKLLNRRGIYDLANQKTKQLQKQLDNSHGISINKSRIQSDLHYYQYYSDNPIKGKQDILRQLANQLLESQSARKLQIYNELLNVNSYRNTYDDLIDQFDLTNDNSFDSVLSNIQINIKNFFQFQSVADFYSLKEYLFSEIIEKKSDLEVILCIYLFNYSFILISQNKIEETHSTIEIANYGLQNNLLTAGRSLSAPRYINIINALAKVNSFEDIQSFIHKWAKAVTSENAEALKIFSIAQYYIINHQYEDIPTQPVLLQFKDIYLKLHSISIYIISNFKQDEIDYEVIFDTIANLKRTLSRYKGSLNIDFYNAYFNFLKVVTLLVNNEKIDLAKYTHLMHRRWITSQITTKQKGET